MTAGPSSALLAITFHSSHGRLQPHVVRAANLGGRTVLQTHQHGWAPPCSTRALELGTENEEQKERALQGLNQFLQDRANQKCSSKGRAGLHCVVPLHTGGYCPQPETHEQEAERNEQKRAAPRNSTKSYPNLHEPLPNFAQMQFNLARTYFPKIIV